MRLMEDAMNTPLRVGIVGLEPGRSWATVALNLHRLLELAL